MRRADLTGPARSSTPPILHPDGTPAHGSVAALEHITLGESHQWVLLRGHSSTNPVVLFLSGGLDGSDITTIRRLLGEIEAQATVVTWDSRGAGKSLFAGFPRGTMTVRQLTADALELVAHLRKRFGQKRIVLVGHSLGTVVAVRMVQERPEWFSAYVSLGQLVNPAARDAAAWRAAVAAADAQAETGTSRQLRRIGPPPYTGRGRLVRYALLARNVAKVLGEDLGLPRLARRTGPRPPELTRLDTVRGWLGRLRTLQLIYPRLQRLDLIAQSTRLGVPVHLVVDGEQASTTKLVERYLAVLDAPSKHLVRFDGSPVDPPYLGRDGAFGQWLVSTVLPGERRSPTAQQP